MKRSIKTNDDGTVGRQPSMQEVAQPNEQGGHVPRATSLNVSDMCDGTLPELDREQPIACYCGSGYRASIAASYLMRGGFRDVRNVQSSWLAWRANKLPVEKPTS